jgi:hypothetical protein
MRSNHIAMGYKENRSPLSVHNEDNPLGQQDGATVLKAISDSNKDSKVRFLTTARY